MPRKYTKYKEMSSYYLSILRGVHAMLTEQEQCPHSGCEPCAGARHDMLEMLAQALLEASE